MESFKHALARITGNTGMYFITPLAGTTLAQIPSIETSLYCCMIGFILASSRELLDYGRQKQNRK
jgi:hypothetical protein